MKIPNLLISTMILFFSNFIVRILGFLYKIILTRTVGEYGLGIYHILFNILMICLALTTTGIPTTLSMLVAKNKTLKDKHKTNVVFISALYSSFFISFFLSFIIYITSKDLAKLFLSDSELSLYFIAICPSIVIITLSNVLRGYYYGLKDVLKPAISQILEQSSRIIFIILIGFYIKNNIFGCYIALIAISVGEIISIFYLMFSLYKDKNFDKNYSINIKDFFYSSVETIKMSIPLTCSRISNVLFHSISSLIIPKRLILSGLNYKEAVSIYGVINGMVMPLIYLPFMLSSALVVNLIPNLSSEMALKNYKKVKLKSFYSLFLTFLVGFSLSLIFYLFSDEICMFLFDNNTLSGKYLKSLFIVPLFLSLNQTLSSILHSIGKEVFCGVVSFLTMTTQIISIYILTPILGIYGYIYTLTFISITTFIIYLFSFVKNMKSYNI